MFQSRDPVFKNPVGAVAAGTNLHFKITLPRSLHCSAATLKIARDGAETADRGMFWCGMNDKDAEWWECDFAPEKSGLYFYTFQLSTARGTLGLSRGAGGEGVLSGGGSWQQTVYSPGGDAPGWLAGGILYQIFPDRFFASGRPKRGVPGDRTIHKTWGEMPEWRPDERGRITNQDYFGGDLPGIREKLPYLKSLGVTCLYLNPVFEAHSNHRYNTADYTKIDPLLGTERDFRELCAEAGRMGIRVLVDGVFSHTGSDSVYFNREGRYPGPGAFQSQCSPYFGWYRFFRWPDSYECWWNFETLPNVEEASPSYRKYICGEEGVARRWLKAGASGWRLDVADELPDLFLDEFSAAVKSEKPDAVVLGEVWEDASNKTAYGRRRRYLLGGQLDSVMNYPFRNAILGFLTGKNPADMMEIVLSIQENYPPQVLHSLMNLIGTHDTERALTVLGAGPAGGRGREWQSAQSLSPDERRLGLLRLRLAAAMQYTLPGVPCIYYGDEAGMEGYRDPFNRKCYPWGHEDASLIAWYRMLGALRRKNADVLARGTLVPIRAQGGCMAYERRDGRLRLLCAFNAGGEPAEIRVPPEWDDAMPELGGRPEDGTLALGPFGCTVLRLPIGG